MRAYACAYMCACACVRMCTCVHACVCACVLACVCVCMRVHACTCACVRVRMGFEILVRMRWFLRKSEQAQIFYFKCMASKIRRCMHVHTYVHVCVGFENCTHMREDSRFAHIYKNCSISHILQHFTHQHIFLTNEK